MKKMLKSLVLGTLIGISNIGINRCMSESLDMNITGNINGLFSTLEIKVVSDSSEGIDNYDNILSENFNTQFYSGVNGEKLSRATVHRFLKHNDISKRILSDPEIIERRSFVAEH